MRKTRIIAVNSATLVFMIAVVFSLAQGEACATVTTFTSLQSWQTTTQGSAQFAANFQGFAQDTYFQTAPVNVGEFTLEQVGHDPVFGDFRNFIDVPPLQFTDNSGVTNAAMYTKYGINTVDMDFSSPVYAWGANFYGAESGELENLVLISDTGAIIATIPVTVDTGFFGFVTSPSQNVASITFESQLDNPDPTVGQGFGLENVVGAYTTTVPEPISLLLLAIGIAVFSAATYRKQKELS